MAVFPDGTPEPRPAAADWPAPSPPIVPDTTFLYRVTSLGEGRAVQVFALGHATIPGTQTYLGTLQMTRYQYLAWRQHHPQPRDIVEETLVEAVLSSRRVFTLPLAGTATHREQD